MFLDYEQPLYRPPSEADNLILQVTIGCKFNRCTFCSMYKSKRYRTKDSYEIENMITTARILWPDATRIFLADGDAFNLSTVELLSVLDKLNAAFPSLRRVSCYATPANILSKTEDELRLLKQKKLNLLYVGIESGNNTLLKQISKGATASSIERALKLADQGGLKVSATIILGLGGKDNWQQHIDDTTRLLNCAPVTYLSTLQLYLDKDAEHAFYAAFENEFEHQDDKGVLLELKQLVENIDPPKRVIFRSNHASNALALAGNLPTDRERLLSEIEYALKHENAIRPEYLRGL